MMFSRVISVVTTDAPHQPTSMTGRGIGTPFLKEDMKISFKFRRVVTIIQDGVLSIDIKTMTETAMQEALNNKNFSSYLVLDQEVVQEVYTYDTPPEGLLNVKPKTT
jgi:hypothetical protein